MNQDTIPQYFQKRIQEDIKILILSANPKETSKFPLDEEIREIKEGLRRSNSVSSFC